MPELAGVFLVGLVGSAHCVGMCGGFALAIAQLDRRAHALQLRQLAYYLGKTTTYALLGAAAGAFGAALSGAFAGMQQGLSLALGLVLVLVGVRLAGGLRTVQGWQRLPGLPGLARLIGRLLGRPSLPATYGLGLLNGLLPCGLVYGMLAVAAAAGGAAQGALVMAVFGLSTVPALYLTALAGFLMQPLWRRRLTVVGGVLVVLLGLFTMARGTPLAGLLHGGHAAAHAAPAAAR